jgi:hypothetical protein
MVYLQSSIKLYPDKLQDFTQTMNELAPALASRHGWKLIGSFASMTGRLHTVLDLWELPDVSAYQAAFADPEVLRFAPRLSAIVEDEVLTLLARLPIG